MEQNSTDRDASVHQGGCMGSQHGEDFGDPEMCPTVMAPCAADPGKPNCDVDPRDIFFVIGASKTYLIPSQPDETEVVDQEGDAQLKLDLSRYSRPNERAPPIAKPISEIDACRKLRSMTAKFEALIEETVRKALKVISSKTCERMGDQHPSAIAISTTECRSAKSLSLPPSKKNLAKPCHKNVVLTMACHDEELDKMGVKPIRYCPVCLKSMSWLPKSSPCLHCGNKPEIDIEVLEETEVLSADQIIELYSKDPNETITCQEPADIGPHLCASISKQTMNLEMAEQLPTLEESAVAPLTVPDAADEPAVKSTKVPSMARAVNRRAPSVISPELLKVSAKSTSPSICSVDRRNSPEKPVTSTKSPKASLHSSKPAALSRHFDFDSEPQPKAPPIVDEGCVCTGGITCVRCRVRNDCRVAMFPKKSFGNPVLKGKDFNIRIKCDPKQPERCLTQLETVLSQIRLLHLENKSKIKSHCQ